jgi:D-arabinitol 2-dehydrogenase
LIGQPSNDAAMIFDRSGDLGEVFAHTDSLVPVGRPGERHIPQSKQNYGQTTRSSRIMSLFSMKGKVCVVTGGVRGLGLVMSQALIISGADVAIVDLNRRLF